MNITITDQEQCKKLLRIEIPSETVRAEVDKIAAKYARQVNIPGFRPGRVPVSVVKNKFRKALREEAASSLVPKALEEAVNERELKALGEPSVEEFKIGDDDVIHIAFIIETRPEFELAGYKELSLTRRIYEVRDEDVEKQIDRLREEQAEMVPVEDRRAQTGDTVTVNMTGRFLPDDEGSEGEAQEASEASAETAGEEGEEADEEFSDRDLDIELGSEGVLNEFNEALADAHPGDERTFIIKYADDYDVESYAGRSVSYKAEVTAIRIKELPEADDEFAQSVDEEYETIEDLRAVIRSDLEKRAETISESELHAEVGKQLLDRNRFEVPESMVKKQMDQRINRLAFSLASQGLDIRQLKIDWDAIRETQREEAEGDVRQLFILARISEVENIEVSEEEIDSEIKEIAEAQGRSVAALKASLTKEGALDSIKGQVKNRKALDFVIASASIQTEKADLSQEAEQ